MTINNLKQTGEDGVYVNADGLLNPEFDHNEIVRFSPKNFTLGAKGQQKVRVSLRKPSDLPDGEYRFHVQGVSYDLEKPPEQDSDNITVSVSMHVGVSIPVIVRHGDVSVEASLTDFELLDPQRAKQVRPALAFKALREGNASTLGNITVDWAPAGEDYRQIGILRNYNVFTEINSRIGQVPLDVLPTNGTLRVKYVDSHTKKLYDEIIFDL
jgi:hypothetical protein